MEEFLEFVIKGLVDHPDEVVIMRLDSEKKTIFTVQVVPGDVGKVIGKHGQTIEALRSVLSAGAARIGKQVVLEIDDQS